MSVNQPIREGPVTVRLELLALDGSVVTLLTGRGNVVDDAGCCGAVAYFEPNEDATALIVA